MVLNSCSSSEKLVTKDWRLNDLEIQSQRDISHLSTRVDSVADAFKDQLHFSINADGTYSSKSPGYEEKGTWKVSEEGDLFETTSEGGQTNQLKILQLNKSSMHIEFPMGNNFMILKLSPQK